MKIKDKNDHLEVLVREIDVIYATLTADDPARYDKTPNLTQPKLVTLIVEKAWQNMWKEITPLKQLEAFYKTLDDDADELNKIIEQEPTVWSTFDKLSSIFEELIKGHFSSIFRNLGKVFEFFQKEIQKENQPLHKMKTELDKIRTNYTSETQDAPKSNDEQPGDEDTSPTLDNN